MTATPPDTAAALEAAIDAHKHDIIDHAALHRAITAHVEAEVARRLAGAPTQADKEQAKCAKLPEALRCGLGRHPRASRVITRLTRPFQAAVTVRCHGDTPPRPPLPRPGQPAPVARHAVVCVGAAFRPPVVDRLDPAGADGRFSASSGGPLRDSCRLVLALSENRH